MNINKWGTTPAHIVTIVAITLFFSCDTNTPEKEDIPETITKVALTFTPQQQEGEVVTVSATDPDKAGPQSIVVDGTIQLKANMTYTLSIDLINGLYKLGEDGYSITDEVSKESDEHQFFYAWTGHIFSDPQGDGNVDKKTGALNYLDKDKNGLPVGLKTKWETGEVTAANSKNTLRVLLKHQPDIKSKTSTSNDGESDLDVTFDIEIK